MEVTQSHASGKPCLMADGSATRPLAYPPLAYCHGVLDYCSGKSHFANTCVILWWLTMLLGEDFQIGKVTRPSCCTCFSYNSITPRVKEIVFVHSKNPNIRHIFPCDFLNLTFHAPTSLIHHKGRSK